jgi:endonuclease/exonuclease/phosphatase family metal-dependent hydrolase
MEGKFVTLGSFNVLSPSWASPEYYPRCAHEYLFPHESRIERVARYVLTTLGKADIVCFQETQCDLDRKFAFLLAERYQYFPVYHDDAYWSKWVTDDRPYLRNGVAVALRRSAFDNISSLDLSLGTGNHAAIVIARHIELDQWFRIASVHFELDDEDIRNAEVEALARFFRPGTNVTKHYVDVIGGDFNSDLDYEVMMTQFLDRGFSDAHRELNLAQPTHPEGEGDDVIDHILIRGDNVEVVTAHTYGADIVKSHPERTDEHKHNRLARCLEYNGSDHFAIDAAIRVPYKIPLKTSQGRIPLKSSGHLKC